MNIKLMVFIVLFSVALWGFSIYYGWLNDVILFGYSVVSGWFDKEKSGISEDEDVTTVKYGEFAYKLLTGIDIPDNITTIENSAFKGNKLSNITIPSNVTYIGKEAFKGNRLTSVIIPSNITSIENGAFKRNELTYIIIPSNVTHIGKGAFDKNRLTNISIGANVSLGDNAFGSGFEAFYKEYEMVMGTYKRPYSESSAWTIWYDNFCYVINDGNITITDYDGFDTVLVIPNEIYGHPVTGIADKAFNMRGLTNVTIPNSVLTIGNEAFRSNVLTRVNIGNSVISIGDNAFDENMLTSIVIPNSVTTIGNNAFCCNLLTSLTLGNSVTYIGTHAFTSRGILRKNQLTSVNIPHSVRNIAVNAFADNPITRISIGADVTLGDVGNDGALGQGSGFNTAYINNNRRAGVYTRAGTRTTTWTMNAQTTATQISSQTTRTISSVNWKWSDNNISLGTQGWSAGVQLFDEPIVNCVSFTLDYEFQKINYGDPFGTQDVYIMNSSGRWSNVGNFNVPNNNNRVTTTIRLSNPSDIHGVGIVPAKSISINTDYENWLTVRDFVVNR